MAVYDSNGDHGKLALAVGYVEDFSASDFLTVLPTAWLESRYFIEDYSTPIIAILVIIGLISIVVFLLFRFIRNRLKVSH